MIIFTTDYFYRRTNNNYFKSYTTFKLTLNYKSTDTIFGISKESLRDYSFFPSAINILQITLVSL